MRLDLYLEDGTIIKNCAIYPEDVETGDQNIQDKEEIVSMLQKVPWGMKHISYQSRLTQGKIHVNNIDKYEFVDEEKTNEKK